MASQKSDSGEVGNTDPTVRKPEKAVLSVYQREELAAMDRRIASRLIPRRTPNRLLELQKQRDALAEATSLTMITEATKPREVRTSWSR